MHAMNQKDGVVVGRRGRRNGFLSGRQALCNDSTTVYAAGSWWVP